MKNIREQKNTMHNWVRENWMGPHPLWLLEELCEHLTLKPGMKVLDMGCGKGITSVFLAKEFGVTVFANDWWISATENLKRFEEAGVAERVFPIHAEAHALPYAEGFFDAAISIDSYQYFGADEIIFSLHILKVGKNGWSIWHRGSGFDDENLQKAIPTRSKSIGWGKCSAFTARIGGGIFGKRPKLSKSPLVMIWKNLKKYGSRGQNGPRITSVLTMWNF
jgi:SAM-dependent methyltransferase